MVARVAALFLSYALAVAAFGRHAASVRASARGGPLYGETVRVKFRIHPDGRIEETVMGVKGTDCTKITEELNEKLGKVLDMKPTEEMYEEKVKVENTVYDQGFSEW